MRRSYLYFLAVLLLLTGTSYLCSLYFMQGSDLLLLFIAINIATFSYMGIDKRQAITGGVRAPERLTYLIAFLGGSIGIVIGCIIFRHKVRKSSFMLILFCIGLLQLLLLGLARIFHEASYYQPR